MTQISLNAPAPDFTLQDFKGESVSLSDFRGKAHILLCSTVALPDHFASGTWRSCARTIRNSSNVRLR